MGNEHYKGFRHGVRPFKCARPAILAETVTELLAQEKCGADLCSLELIELGAVYVNDERCLNPARALIPGDQLRVHTDPRRFKAPGDLSRRILAETEDALLVEKPAGIPADPQVDNAKENLLSFLEDLRGQNLYLTHRQSADTEGLMLVAKSPNAQARLKQAFAENRVRRIYAAYVETPPENLEFAPFRIVRCEERKTPTHLIGESRMTWQIKGDPLQKSFRLEIEFTAARPREIREAFSKMGMPIIGDRAFGSRIELEDAVTLKPAIAFRALSLEV